MCWISQRGSWSGINHNFIITLKYQFLVRPFWMEIITQKMLIICTKSKYITGPSEGLKIRGCQYSLVGIICPLDWDRFNWSAKIWEGYAPPALQLLHPPNDFRTKYRLYDTFTDSLKKGVTSISTYFYYRIEKIHSWSYIIAVYLFLSINWRFSWGNGNL